ncbi:O-antigen ligase family protein [bacterium]|nr:O-antigen ligase family protein [bacterium]
MLTKKATFNLQIPKLDAFDVFAMTLWFGVLIPAVQLPSSATFTFLRSVFFIMWTGLFFAYIAYRIFSEKKMIFYSSTVANTLIAALGVTFILSYIISASRIDSLFGYDLSFSSSLLILLALIVLYFSLKLAGLSLEFAVSRVLAVLPFTLFLLDGISLVAYLLPAGFFERLLGNYAQYFTFFSSTPASLFGGIQQALFVHVIAIVIAVWQIAAIYKKGEKMGVDLYRRLIIGIFTILATSYLFFYSYTFSIISVILFLFVGTCIGVLIVTSKSKLVKQFGTFLICTVAIVGVLGFVWNKTGVTGKQAPIMISTPVSTSIIRQGFLNSSTPMWRQLVGFGVGTFPYLYMQYRTIDDAQRFGNDTFFFKPSSYIFELFVEHGIVGVLLFSSLLIVTILAFRRASAKDSLVIESTLLLITFATLLLSPSSLVVLIVLFVLLASFYDKLESLPESLPAVRAIDLKESTYTNKSTNKGGVILVIVACAYAVMTVYVLYAPVMTMIGYTKALQRYTVAKVQVTKKDTKALSTYSDAFSLAGKYKLYCTDCAQLPYLSLSTLIGTSALYSGLTPEQKATSTELQQIKNMTLQAITDVLAKNTIRYDYWFTIAQAYQTIAGDEKSSSLYTLSVQSIRNALSVNQYSIDANYLYVDILLRLGNSDEINVEVRNKLATLKKLVGSPYQIRFIEGIMLAREKDYAGAIKTFQSIKKDVGESSLTVEEKNAVSALAEQRANEVTKLQQTDKSTPIPSTTLPPKPTVQTN